MCNQETMPSKPGLGNNKYVRIIETHERGNFDAIVDEALANNPLAQATVVDGVAVIEDEKSVTIAILTGE